jgi:hypothetical protein
MSDTILACARRCIFLGGSALPTDALILFLGILPLCLTGHIPMLDLPAHLARQHVMQDLSTSPELQTFYTIRWRFIPNLGIDMVVSMLRQVMPVDLAVRLFCITGLVMMFAGTRTVNLRASGGSSRIYRVSPLFFYSGPFQFGFVSFWFGIGLALLLFGIYMRLSTRTPTQAGLIVVVPGIFLLLCHIMAFGCFLIAAGSVELVEMYEAIRARGRVGFLNWARVTIYRLGPVAIIPLALLTALGPSEGGDLPYVWSNLRERIEALAAIMMFALPALDIAILTLAALGAAIAFAGRAVRLRPEGVVTVLCLALAFFAFPRFGRGGSYIDYRFPSAIVFFLIAFTVPGQRFDRFAGTLVGWFGGLTVARVAMICTLWLAWEPVFAEFETAFALLPLGAPIAVVEGRLGSVTATRNPPLEHVAEYAVARRHAFSPWMFGTLRSQIIGYQPRYYDPSWSHAPPSTLDTIAPYFRYILVLYPEAARIGPGICTRTIATGRAFELLEVCQSAAVD